MEQTVTERSIWNKGVNWPTRVKVQDLALFCRQLASMLEVGMPLRAAMEVLAEQGLNKNLCRIIADMVRDLDQGKDLSEIAAAFPRVFPPSFLAMVEAGELTGQMEEVLHQLATYYQKEYQLAEELKSALLYPAVVCCTAVIVVITMFTLVIPTFAGVLQNLGGELPLPTKILLFLSSRLSNNFTVIAGTILGGLIFLMFFAKTGRGQFFLGKISLALPGIGQIKRKILAARFSRTFGALLAGGVPILEALAVVQKLSSNKQVQLAITKVRDSLSKGETMAPALFSANIFPLPMVRMVVLGEETGTLEKTLARVAQIYEGEVEETLRRFLTLLEPAFTVALALLVGFIVVAMLMPMFQIYSQVR